MESNKEDIFSADTNVNIEFAVSKALDWLMGEALDMARISSMDDRAFRQFDRTMKDSNARVKEYTLNLLKQKGLI